MAVSLLTPDITSEEIQLLDLYGFKYDPLKFDTIIGKLDPFLGSITQTNRLRAFCEINVAGINVTDKLLPHLISVRIIDTSPDCMCELEIDDRDGKLPLPPLGAPVFVALGWQSENLVTVFNGTIEDFEHGFGRKQGGRRMYVHAKGVDEITTAVKEPMQDHAGEGAPPGQKEGKLIGLPDWIGQMAKNAKINVDIDNAFAKIKQDYWHQANDSLMHKVQELSEQFGFTHQFREGNKLVVQRPGFKGICCVAVWRDNLIAWRVRPLAQRSSFKGAAQQWFDKEDSHWNFSMQKFGLSFPFTSNGSAYSPRQSAPTEGAAGSDNSGSQTKSETQEGNGRIIINGEPKAVWNGLVLLQGARPGVDGLYIIEQVEHIWSRQGFITMLEVTTEANAPEGLGVSGGFADLPRPAPNQG